MTLTDRIAAFKAAYPKWPASWPSLVQEQGRDVLYATWLIGNDYRNATKFYGSYPPGYLARMMAFFPGVRPQPFHVFSGSLPKDTAYVRCDVNPALQPDVLSNVYDLPQYFTSGIWERRALVLADPPYSAADALKYKTPMVDRRRAMAALAHVTRAGGHLVWLDTVWPMHRKAEWVTVGRITVVRSTNHRVRMATIFERAS